MNSAALPEYEGTFTMRAAQDMSEGFQQQTDAVLRHLDGKGVLGGGVKAFISQMNGAGFSTSFMRGAAGEAYIDHFRHLRSDDCGIRRDHADPARG